MTLIIQIIGLSIVMILFFNAMISLIIDVVTDRNLDRYIEASYLIFVTVSSFIGIFLYIYTSLYENGQIN